MFRGKVPDVVWRSLIQISAGTPNISNISPFFLVHPADLGIVSLQRNGRFPSNPFQFMSHLQA
jgi:hypothetical protein